MLTVFPATTTLVARADELELLGTETIAVPLPEPDPLTLAQDVVEDDHAQPLAVVTVTLCALPPGVKLSAVGDTA